MSPASRTKSSRRSCARSAIRSTPSTAAPASRSIHGNHGQFETRSPVYTFVPYKVKGETNLIAGYLCTPLVKFPVNSLKPGAKVHGHDDRRARQPQSAARHDRLQEGRQGVPADVEQQPRRDEDPDRRLRHGRQASPARVRRTRPACGYENDHRDEGRGAARPARRHATPSCSRAPTPASSTSTSSPCRKRVRDRMRISNERDAPIASRRARLSLAALARRASAVDGRDRRDRAQYAADGSGRRSMSSTCRGALICCGSRR